MKPAQKSNAECLANAAHRLMQAERTGDAAAIKRAQAYLNFYEGQVMAEGALARQAAQAEAEYAADPAAFAARRHAEACASEEYYSAQEPA